MQKYETVIGLEVHVQLATKSKLFCSCSTQFGQPANINTCEVCAGMPGALPVVNQQAVHYAALVGFATNCHVHHQSIFARKNYFYPDLPSGYQISQFDLPICEHGYLDVIVDGKEKRLGITRIHMENDAGKNIHSQSEDASYVDLNRAGTPLVEIVSEPDMRSAAEAAAYLRKLYSIVTYLGICDGNMEEGSFRCDANVSIRPYGSETFGTRTELKNLNSFRNVQRAIEYEVERQQDILEDGGSIIQETRLYDADKNVTISMRSKEEAHDYRYFPDPDFLPVTISDEDYNKWKNSIPELPDARAKRFVEMTKLPEAEVDLLIQSRDLADFFENAAKLSDARKVANFIIGPLVRECSEKGLSILDPSSWKMTSETLAKLVKIVDDGVISNKIANDIFGELLVNGLNPEEYVKEKGLVQISDTSAIEEIVKKVVESNPNEVEAYKNGKTKLISFFVGQVMRETKGKANPSLVNKLLAKTLNS